MKWLQMKWARVGWLAWGVVSVGIWPAAAKPRFPLHVELANIQRAFERELPDRVASLGKKNLPVDKFLFNRNHVEDRARKELTHLIELANENKLIKLDEGPGILGLLFPTAKQRKEDHSAIGSDKNEMLIKAGRKLSNKTFGNVFLAAIDFSDVLDELNQTHRGHLKVASSARTEKNRLRNGIKGLKVAVPNYTARLQSHEKDFNPADFGKRKGSIRQRAKLHLRSALTAAVNEGLLSAQEADEVTKYYFGSGKAKAAMDVESEAHVENKITMLRDYPQYKPLIEAATKGAREVALTNRNRSRTEDKLKIILTGFSERLPQRLKRYASQGGEIGRANAKALNAEARKILQRGLETAVDGETFLVEDAHKLASLLFPSRLPMGEDNLITNAMKDPASDIAVAISELKSKVPTLTQASEILKHAELFSTKMLTFLATPPIPAVPIPVHQVKGLSPTAN